MPALQEVTTEPATRSLMEWLMSVAVEGESIDIDELVGSIPDEYACPNCSQARLLSASNLVNTSDNGIERWCQVCTDEAFRCIDCNTRQEESLRHDLHTECCQECGEIRVDEDNSDYNEDYDDEEDGILDYNAKIRTPRKNWPGAPKNKRYFGIELEVETKRGHNRYNQVEQTRNLIDESLFIMKHDGSLNNGFEIVSAPASLDKVDDLWGKFLKNTPEGLRSERTETCGMHVHVSRSSMSPLTLGKALVFMNNVDNCSFVTRIAGREENSYCSRKNKTLKSGQVVNSEDRYEILNVTAQTAEFRLFRGTLTKSTFMKNVEFTNAIIEFCSQSSMKDLKWTSFVEWMKKQSRAQYPYLKKFLATSYPAMHPHIKPKPEKTKKENV